MPDKPEPSSGPGKDVPHGPWEALARQLAANPDSPTSLKIMSALGQALRPSRQAAEQLVHAYTAQLESPGDKVDAAVLAAERHWEATCRTELDDALRQQLRDEAARALARRRRAPPAVESVVAGLEGRTDTGYDLGLHLEGLRGTWHRLWAAIALGCALGDSAEQQGCVATVRGQFEEILGRSLLPAEWDTLAHHAMAHGRTMGGEMANRVAPSSAGGDPKNSDSAT